MGSFMGAMLCPPLTVLESVNNNNTAWPFMTPQARAAYMWRIHSATGFSPIKLLTSLDDPAPLPLGDLLPDLPAAPFSSARILLATLHHRTPEDISTPLDRAFTSQIPPFSDAELSCIDSELKLGHRIASIITPPRMLPKRLRSVKNFTQPLLR